MNVIVLYEFAMPFEVVCALWIQTNTYKESKRNENTNTTITSKNDDVVVDVVADDAIEM